MQGYQCRCCGEYHDKLPLHYGAKAPIYYFEIPEEQHAKRCLLSPDQCVIDDQYFFIVGNLELPIIGSNEKFSWDVWVSLSQVNFERVSELWEQVERESVPPYFGWLSTRLPGYPDTINLKTLVHTQPVGFRPSIELESTDHPLAVEQREGITWEQVQDIAELILHEKQ